MTGRPEGDCAGIEPALLRPGFGNLVLDSQVCFRVALRAISRPGTALEVPVHVAPPAPLAPALAALALTLLDADTTVWLDAAAGTEAVRTFLRFHCGCRLVDDPARAAFALIAAPAEMPALGTFDPGHEEYPDRSGTLLVQLPALHGGAPLVARGPGIDGVAALAPLGLGADFVTHWSANHALYPQGVDMFLLAGRELLGLPRSVALAHAGPDPEVQTPCT